MEEGHTLPGVRIEWDKRGVDKMAMSVIWTGMVAISILCGLATGRGPAVAAAAAEGASAAVELARHNAALAGVEDCVRFEEADAGKFRRRSEYGQLVTNPPYGERLLEKEEAEALYRAFGKALEDLPPKWRVIVLSSHTEFERCFGRPADKKRKLYNGMLKCDAFFYGR